MSVITQITVAIVYLMYIGTRPHKKDNVCGTGTVWHGYGDVQPVEKKHLPDFLKHSDVWKQVDSPDAKPPAKEKVPEKVQAPAPTGVNGSAGDESPDGNPDENPDDNPDGKDLSKVTAAILGLESGNSDHFGSNGVPKVAAVRVLAGDETITGEDVKAAWSELKKGS